MKQESNSKGKGFNIADNTQASPVKNIKVDSEKYDMGKIQPYSDGTKGYPSQALPHSI